MICLITAHNLRLSMLKLFVQALLHPPLSSKIIEQRTKCKIYRIDEAHAPPWTIFKLLARMQAEIEFEPILVIKRWVTLRNIFLGSRQFSMLFTHARLVYVNPHSDTEFLKHELHKHGGGVNIFPYCPHGGEKLHKKIEGNGDRFLSSVSMIISVSPSQQTWKKSSFV